MNSDDNDNVGKYSEDQFVLKCKVPFRDANILRDWNKSCQLPESQGGYKDYRWGKIKSDHVFKEQYHAWQIEMSQSITELKTEIQELRKHLENDLGTMG